MLEAQRCESSVEMAGTGWWSATRRRMWSPRRPPRAGSGLRQVSHGLQAFASTSVSPSSSTPSLASQYPRNHEVLYHLCDTCSDRHRRVCPALHSGSGWTEPLVGCAVSIYGVCSPSHPVSLAVSGEVNDITWTCETSPYQNFTVL